MENLLWRVWFEVRIKFGRGHNRRSTRGLERPKMAAQFPTFTEAMQTSAIFTIIIIKDMLSFMIYPSSLPAPQQLKSIMRSMAALDAILSPEWQYRYYSFDRTWGPSEQMGSIRNGSGDDLFVLFNQSGCFLKGFSHEYPQHELSPNMFYENIPDAFQAGTIEPAFSPQNVSYCAWQDLSGEGWKDSVKEKSLDFNVFFLIQDLDGQASTFQKFVAEYHEMEVDLGLLQAVFDQTSMTKGMAKSLNPEIEYSSLLSDLKQIGYPHQAEALEKPKGFLGKLFGRD